MPFPAILSFFTTSHILIEAKTSTARLLLLALLLLIILHSQLRSSLLTANLHRRKSLMNLLCQPLEHVLYFHPILGRYGEVLSRVCVGILFHFLLLDPSAIF